MVADAHIVHKLVFYLYSSQLLCTNCYVLALTIQTRNGLEIAMMLLFLLPSAGIAGVSHHALPNCSHSVSLLSSCGVYNFDAGLVSFCHIFESVCTYILMAILSLSVHKY